MNANFLKKMMAMIAILMTLCASAVFPALAEGEEGEEGEQAEQSVVSKSDTGRHLADTAVVDLGKVPDETATEEKCEVLLVADVASGVLIHEKNIDVQMPVGGAAVQLMTAVVALDYLSLEDTILIDSKIFKDLPGGTQRMNLKQKNEILVSDLIAAMLYTGAVDAAVAVISAVEEVSNGKPIAYLMNEKAEQLGMTSSDYAGSDGIGITQVQTTARDQCELYMEALSNEGLQSILKPGVYKVESKNQNGKQNENLPDKVVNNVSVVVPENRLYDVRLSSAVSCTVKSYRKDDESSRFNAIFVRAMDYRTDMAMIFWTKSSSQTIAAKPLYNLTDIFSRRKIVDLIPYIEVAANSLTVEKSGVSITGWFLTEGHVMFGRQMASYDPDAKKQDTSNDFDLAKMSVLLKPELSSLVTNEDGSRNLQAKVLVNNSVEGTVLLATAPKATQTIVSQNTNVLYTEEDVTPPEPTLMSQYGWIIIIGGVALLAMIVIVIGVLIRNRMERW